MAHYRIIDTASGPAGTIHFYRQFANPSFNLCVPIAAQPVRMCEGPSGLVFQLALYALLRAASGTAATPARAER